MQGEPCGKLQYFRQIQFYIDKYFTNFLFKIKYTLTCEGQF